MTRPFKVVGLTGGIGSGKSSVATLFGKSGASVVDADAIAHDAVDLPGPRKRLVKAFGPSILRQGRIHRPSLAALAFRSAADVRRLNRALHPAIGAELRKALRAAMARGGLFVIDAALLMETGISAWCDVIVHVDAPRALRARRVASRGWKPAELRRRERFQWPEGRKRKAADAVIRNGGSLAATRRQVRDLIDKWSGDVETRP